MKRKRKREKRNISVSTSFSTEFGWTHINERWEVLKIVQCAICILLNWHWNSHFCQPRRRSNPSRLRIGSEIFLEAHAIAAALNAIDIEKVSATTSCGISARFVLSDKSLSSTRPIIKKTNFLSPLFCSKVNPCWKLCCYFNGFFWL